jgi:copper(I)-binding protein
VIGTRGVLVGAVCVLALSGCGAGQEAATANQVTASGGSAGSSGSLVVRNAQFTWSDPVPGGFVYPAGADAALQVSIINEKTPGPGDGDRLVEVSSPIAAAGRIIGDASIPDGQVLTAGYDLPVASIELPGTRSVDIALVGLTVPVRAGLTYPVVFTFENAGDVRLEVGVENPQILPPRARDGAAEDPSFLETGPDVTPR